LKVGDLVKNKLSGSIGSIVSIHEGGITVEAELPRYMGQSYRPQKARFSGKVDDFVLIKTAEEVDVETQLTHALLKNDYKLVEDLKAKLQRLKRELPKNIDYV